MKYLLLFVLTLGLSAQEPAKPLAKPEATKPAVEPVETPHALVSQEHQRRMQELSATFALIQARMQLLTSEVCNQAGLLTQNCRVDWGSNQVLKIGPPVAEAKPAPERK